MPSLSDLHDEYEFLDADDRYRLLIDLGRTLEPMPDALKTDATLVRGCSASVWVYPTVRDDGALHFLADSNQLSSNRTQGIPNMIALIKATAERYAA
jgi:cysteine desulfuration protein SufE